MGVISPSIPHLVIPLFLETSLGFIPQTKTKITTGEQIHRFQLNVSNQEEEETRPPPTSHQTNMSRTSKGATLPMPPHPRNKALLRDNKNHHCPLYSEIWGSKCWLHIHSNLGAFVGLLRFEIPKTSPTTQTARTLVAWR